MQLKDYKWIVLLVVLHVTSTIQSQYFGDSDYFYSDPDMDDDAFNFNTEAEGEQGPRGYYYSAVPRSIIPVTEALFSSDVTTECETEKPATPPPTSTTTECIPEKSGGGESTTKEAPTTTPASESSTPAHEETSTTPAPSADTTTTPATSAESTTQTSTPGPETTTTMSTTTTTTTTPQPPASGSTPAPPPPQQIAMSSDSSEAESKTKELHQLVQHLYIAQARVQLEATEIKKAQAVANSAQQMLEEAANHVRTITATLQNAQQEVASAAIRAQTAQLQLAAHDQLLFAARQDVDALSSQMVGIQAAEGFTQPKVQFDLGGLLERLRQPLPEAEKPTAVPPLVPPPPIKGGRTDRMVSLPDFYYD